MTPPMDSPSDNGRIRLIVKVVIFQLKLLFDGLRDLLLVPASWLCMFIGIFFGGKHPDQAFQKLLALGRKSDEFLNLFDQHEADAQSQITTADSLLSPYQERLVEQAQASKISNKANSLVDAITERANLKTNNQDKRP